MSELKENLVEPVVKVLQTFAVPAVCTVMAASGGPDALLWSVAAATSPGVMDHLQKASSNNPSLQVVLTDISELRDEIARLTADVEAAKGEVGNCLASLMSLNSNLYAASSWKSLGQLRPSDFILPDGYSDEVIAQACEKYAERLAKTMAIENQQLVCQLLEKLTRDQEGNETRFRILIKNSVEQIEQARESLKLQRENSEKADKIKDAVDSLAGNSEDQLLQRFLEWQTEQFRVDPYLKGNRACEDGLLAVYQPLRVSALADKDLDSIQQYRQLESNDRPSHQSLLLTLAENPQLVLLGDAGSGKSSFSRYLLAQVGSAEGREQILRDFDAEARLFDQQRYSRDDKETYAKRLASQRQALQKFLDSQPLPLFLPLHLFSEGLTGADLDALSWLGLLEHFVARIEAFAPHAERLARLLWQSKARLLILLDGLDEVSDSDRAKDNRRKQFIQWLDGGRSNGSGLQALVKNSSRVLVASRPYAYSGECRLLSSKPPCVQLQPLNVGQTQAYTKRVLPLYNPQREPEALLQALANNQAVKQLCQTPLVLAMVVKSFDDSGGEIPRLRAKLYEQALNTLLYVWPVDKRQLSEAPCIGDSTVHVAGLNVLYQPLVDQLRDDRQANAANRAQLVLYLEALAFEIHHSASKSSHVRVPLDKLYYLCGAFEQWLLEHSALQTLDRGILVQYLREHAGLLIDEDKHRFRFVHQSFKDYLVARYLLRAVPQADLWPHQIDANSLATLFKANPEHWREVWQLALQQRLAQGGWQAASELIGQSLPAEKRNKEQRANYYAARSVLALALEELQGVQEPGKPEDALSRQIESLRQQLCAAPHKLRSQFEGLLGLVKNPVPPQQLAPLGRALAWLGDQRPGVATTTLSGTPILDWMPMEVPEDWATCAMVPGTKGDSTDYLALQAGGSLPLADFYISRYPITNAQFAAFLAAGDAAPFRRGLTIDPDPAWPLCNHPRVDVTWAEAVAFCRWLNGRLEAERASAKEQERQCRHPVGQVRLPTEWEWHFAATGGGGPQLGSEHYPWGDNYQLGRANINEGSEGVSLGRTTAVGTYPAPEGHPADMVGNVWEWCLNTFEDWESAGSLKPSTEGTRALRGGSWGNVTELAALGSRDYDRGGSHDDFGGFRVVCSSAMISDL